ncbi:hypothetical protein [Guptibacillus algicola]|uniref:hypothetical protein n=1 Tax=Guptibacillus algicola TaxID=225844 RepID=UPI001CD36D58|nr:hypothetical protein [Alkalihalobacillus algicola]MCA0988863.1 hypothetical protein [Alkalihalobacillus algicola]
MKWWIPFCYMIGTFSGAMLSGWGMDREWDVFPSFAMAITAFFISVLYMVIRDIVPKVFQETLRNE